MRDADSEIIWPAPDEPLAGGTCLACGAAGPHEPAVSVTNPFVAGDVIRFARCRACGSLTAAGRLLEYTDDDGLDPEIWRHYLHVGAGIDFMVRPLERVRREGAAPSLLDVGCGFGFTLDYWRRMTGGEVAGVEPSGYGRMGREMLGLPIQLAYLSEANALRGRRFDLVFSSEVIEHVPDPAAFLQELRGHLAPGGTLILTTPRAEFVRPENTGSVLLSVLSPGLHKLLFSARALEAALRDAGFAAVRVEEQSERLIAFAADVALTLLPPNEDLSERYLEYLLWRAEVADQPADLKLGFRFRAAKELVNRGRAQEAAPQAEAFEALVRQQYGYDPLDSASVRSRVLPAASLAEYGQVAPFCLGPFLYYRAMLERRGGDALRAADLFGLAFEVLGHAVEITPIFAQEAASLVWLARMEQGCALLVGERRDEAIAVFDSIPATAEAAEGALRFGVLTPQAGARTAFERAVALLQLRRYAEAIAGFGLALAAPGGTPEMRAHAHQLLMEASDILRAQDPRPEPAPANAGRNAGWRTLLGYVRCTLQHR